MIYIKRDPWLLYVASFSASDVFESSYHIPRGWCGVPRCVSPSSVRGTSETSHKAKSAEAYFQYISPSSFAVLGSSYDWRVNSSMTFNPTNSSAPIFQIFDPNFLSILGSEPSLRLVASNPDFAFAHEAPVWVPDSDEVFFTSNGGGSLGRSGLDQNNQMGKISLQEVAAAIGNGTRSINVTVTAVSFAFSIALLV